MDDDYVDTSLFELYDVKERIEGNVLCVIGNGWMRKKKRKVNECKKVEIIGSINLITVYKNCSKINLEQTLYKTE